MSALLDALNKEQAQAAATITGPVLVLAGAGTGKTRVITYRIAHMIDSGIDPENILGLTFTNKAAAEMRERLAGLIGGEAAGKVTLCTFHSFCARVLRREIDKLGYLPGFTIADESDQLGILKQVVGEIIGDQDKFPIPEAHAMIGRWKNRLATPAEVKLHVDNDFEATAAELYARYQELLELQNLLDFDDLLLLTYRVFSEFPEVLARWYDRYRYLLIDEYQDTNAAQLTLVKMLAGERRNICAVGDDDQSIYSWRGADVSNILDFSHHFPGGVEVKLEQNYRSTTAILNAANAVIGSNPRRHVKKLWSQCGEGDKVKIVRAADGEAEADKIASAISQKIFDGSREYRDFAILYRSNHLSREIEQALRRLSIPYRLVGGQEFFKRREIKDAVAYLRLLVNPRDDQSLLRILGTPPRGLAAKAVELLKTGRTTMKTPMIEQLGSDGMAAALPGKAAAAARELHDVVMRWRKEFKTDGNLAARITSYLTEVGYLNGLQRIYKDIDDVLKRRENIDEFINAVAQFESRAETPSLGDFLESFSLLEENDRTEENEDGNTVTLSSIHAAKGLEFPVVFVVAVEEGIFPHERALAEGGLAEELRLFYVALTRAKQELYLFFAANRMQRGYSRPALASRFLALLKEDIAERIVAEDMLRPPAQAELDQAFASIFKMLGK